MSNGPRPASAAKKARLSIPYCKEFLDPELQDPDLRYFETTPKERRFGLLTAAYVPLKSYLIRVATGEAMAVGGLNIAVFARDEGEKLQFLRELPDPSTRKGCEYHELVRDYLLTVMKDLRKKHLVDAGPEVQTEEFLTLFTQKVLFRELLISYFTLLGEGKGTGRKEAKRQAIDIVDTKEFQSSYAIFYK
jgi:hypothetical protein